MTSLRKVMQQIDQLDPPKSLTQFAERFRYPNLPLGQRPAGAFSIRQYDALLNGADVRKIDFLHLNCWLLPATFGLKEVVESFGSLAKLAACLLIRAEDLLVKLLQQVDVSDLCNAFFPKIFTVCGVSPNLMYDGCVLAAGSILKLADWLLNAAGWTIDEAVYLLDIPSNLILDALNLSIDISDKPEMDERAIELGQIVWNYDIASLVEVWNRDMQLRILARGGAPDGSRLDTYKGRFTTGPTRPAGSWKQLDSGIFVLVPTLPITDHAEEGYKADGHHSTTGCDFGPLVDSDRWADKGVQLTRIDVGVGVIDLFTTHIYSGGDPILPNWASWPFDSPPSDDEIAKTREAQVTQLCTFISQHRRPGNITIVTGDFNIPGSYSLAADGTPQYAAHYAFLKNSMHGLGLEDWWVQAPFQSIVTNFGNEGITNRHGDGDKPYFNRFDMVCKPFTRRGTDLPDTKLLVPQPDNLQSFNDYYCDDSKASTDPQLDGPGNRIDYIFVETATAAHSFSINCTRLRRRAFGRNGSQAWGFVQEVSDDNGSQVHLSDHLGLEMTIYASPHHR